MFKRLISAMAIGASLIASGAAAEPIHINTLSNYLNRISSATSGFTQINSNGSVDKGNLYMQKPYRMRFEYSTQNVLVLASGGQVAIFEDKGNAQQYPMSKTPLSLILAPHVDIQKQGAVVAHGEMNGNTIVTVKDPSGQTPGSIEMLFSPGPELRQWVVTDESGQRTTVILDGLRSGVEFRPSTFSIHNEVDRRKSR